MEIAANVRERSRAVQPSNNQELMMTSFKTLALTAVALASAGVANAADFVLQAPQWGAAQNAAVLAAGAR
jgi:hypothetical protein